MNAKEDDGDEDELDVFPCLARTNDARGELCRREIVHVASCCLSKLRA